MKILKSLLIVFCIFLSISVQAQQKKDTLTILEKFDKIYRISTSYQEYKVISKERYRNLKNQVADSIKDLKSKVLSNQRQIESQKDSINGIKKIAATFETDWRQTLAQKNSIRFLGIEFSKSTYNIIVWSIITILLVFLLYFMYRFKNSNVLTTNAKSDLIDLEQEFAIHKKKSLEREQKLRRQLQDEINKQRGV